MRSFEDDMAHYANRVFSPAGWGVTETQVVLELDQALFTASRYRSCRRYICLTILESCMELQFRLSI